MTTLFSMSRNNLIEYIFKADLFVELTNFLARSSFSLAFFEMVSARATLYWFFLNESINAAIKESRGNEIAFVLFDFSEEGARK